jgi:hypothetical protein
VYVREMREHNENVLPGSDDDEDVIRRMRTNDEEWHAKRRRDRSRRYATMCLRLVQG